MSSLQNSSTGNDPVMEMMLKRGDTGLVTFNMLLQFLVVNNWGMCQCVTVVGLVANVLNIIIFVQQGARDTVNISLLGLTISDLGSLVFLFFINLCWTPSFMALDLPFYTDQMMYFLFWGHVIFTRVTTGTTAWIACERCLCISLPLRVKTLVTPARTVLYISSLYVIMFGAVAPIFYTSRFAWIFDASKNKSLLGYLKIKNRIGIEGVVYLFNNFLPLVFFIFIVDCTIVLVRTMWRNTQWRQRTASSMKSTAMSNRDAKVVKMVLFISMVFIFCYAPGAVFFIWLVVDPEMKIDGKEKNLMGAVFSILLHLEGINASINFFIYLKMSSKFYLTFQQLACVSRAELT